MTTSVDEEVDNLTQIELRRRRQSFIFLLFFFFLIRLWLQALLTGDSGLVPLCVILTIWFTRIQHQRRSEDEELQSQWQQVLGRQLQQQQRSTNEDLPDLPGRSSNAAVDLRLAVDHVPYQLQLAIAMLESQRMMEAVAANGNLPIRVDQGNNSRGVTEHVRAQWKHYKFGHGDSGQTGTIENESSSFTNVMESSSSTGLEAISGEKNRENQIGSAVASRESNGNQSIYSIFHRAFASRRRGRQGQSNTNIADYSVPNDNFSRLESDGAIISSKNTITRNQYTSLLDDNHKVESNYDELRLSLEVPFSEEEESLENHALTKPTTAIKFDEEGTPLQQHVTANVVEEGEFSCCSICLEPYVKGDDLAELPCKHVFHDECISVWTSNNVKCPLCNFDLELGGRDLV